MSAIEYSGGAMRPVHGKDQLFQGKKFFLAAHIPQRSSYREKIESHGGVVVKVESSDAYMVVDHLRKSRITQQDAISYRFVDECIRFGSLRDADEFRIHAAATPRPAGDVSRRGRSAKVPFTREEDLFLWDNMTMYIEHGGSKQGKKSFEEIEQQRPRHTWQSWRERWIKQLMDKPRPVPLPEQHATNAGTASARRNQTSDEAQTRGPAVTLSEVKPIGNGAGAAPEDGAGDETQDAASHFQTEVPESTGEETFLNSSGELSAVLASDADKGKLMMLSGDILNVDPEQADAAWTAFAAVDEHQHHSKERWMQIWNEVMLPIMGHMVQSWRDNVGTDQNAIQDNDAADTGEASQGQGIVVSADKGERSPAQANSKRRRETLQTSQSTTNQSDTPNSSARGKRRDPMSSGLFSYQESSERETKRMRLADAAADASSEAAQVQNRNDQTQDRAIGPIRSAVGISETHEDGEDAEAEMEPECAVEVERDEQDTSAPDPTETQHTLNTAFIQEETNNSAPDPGPVQDEDEDLLHGNMQDSLYLYTYDNGRDDSNGEEMEEDSIAGSPVPDSESLGNSPRPRASTPSSRQPGGTDDEGDDGNEDGNEDAEQETANPAMYDPDQQIDDTEEASALFFDFDNPSSDQEEDENIPEHETVQTTNQPHKPPFPNSTPISEPDSSNIPTTIPGNTARSIPLSSGPSQRDLPGNAEPSSSRSNYIHTTQPGFTSQLQMSSPGMERAAEPGRKTSLIDSREGDYTSSVTGSSYDEDEDYEDGGAGDEKVAAAAAGEASDAEDGAPPTNQDQHNESDNDESNDYYESNRDPNKTKTKPNSKPSKPPISSPVSSSSSSASDHQLETWFQQRLASGYIERDIADALHASSLQLDLADEALIYLQQTGELPYGTRGIWTKGDDADLAVLSLRGGEGGDSDDEDEDDDDEDESGSEGGKDGKRKREEREERRKRRRRRERMEQRRRRLMEKHGEAYFWMRVEFLELEFS